MNESAVLTADAESVVWIESSGGPIAGIITRPEKQMNRGAVLLCGGGWYGTVTNRNRVYVRLARRLAAAGYHVLRFDWRGVGESAGRIDRFDLDSLFVDDVLAAARYLESEVEGNLVVIGNCFGARAALGALGKGLTPRSLALVSFPVPKPVTSMKSSWYGERLKLTTLARTALKPWAINGFFDARVRRLYRKAVKFKWRSLTARVSVRARPAAMHQFTVEALVLQLQDLVARDASVLFLFGEDDLARHVFDEFCQGALNDLLARPERLVQVDCAPGDMHTFDTMEAQDAFIDRMTAWVAGGGDQRRIGKDRAATVRSASPR